MCTKSILANLLGYFFIVAGAAGGGGVASADSAATGSKGASFFAFLFWAVITSGIFIVLAINSLVQPRSRRAIRSGGLPSGSPPSVRAVRLTTWRREAIALRARCRRVISWLSVPLTPLDAAVRRHLRAVGGIGRNAAGRGWTRYAFSPEEKMAHDYAARILRENSYITTVDGFGNLRARKELVPGAPWVLLGTHLDTVAEGGNFDGVVGFIVAVEAVVLAEAAGLTINIEIVIFRAEESTRFGKAVLGSRAAFGFLSADDLDELRDTLRVDGTATLRHALVKERLKAEEIGRATIDADSYAAYFETHIEQGRILEEAGALGVVTSIRAPERRLVIVSGPDAVRVVAAMICQVENLAEQFHYDGFDIVATVGRVEGFFTGATKINAIPGDVSIPLARLLNRSEIRLVRSLARRRGIRVSMRATKTGASLRFVGVTDHSGATPMGWLNRRDALVAAAVAVSVLNKSLFPLESRIQFYLDLRSNAETTRELVSRQIAGAFNDMEKSRAVSLRIGAPIELTKPITSLHPACQNLIQDAARELGVSMRRIPSGAGHDAMIAAEAGIPTAMIFVPSVGGLSHCPGERTEVRDISNAIQIQARVLEALSRRFAAQSVDASADAGPPIEALSAKNAALDYSLDATTRSASIH
jgi:acetylornithine deacetylase/succinyl-diaminopimelate desuccinylase-like protein